MTVGSLFAGIGGFDLAFTRAGYEVRWQIEIDPWARAILAKHWPSARRYSDVRRASLYNLETVDVICGGFPCTDLSSAGKGLGLDGPQSGLWREFIKVIRALRPRYVVVENVPTLTDRGLGRILGDLATSGYDAEWDCIPAAAVGAPHLRDRLWLVAARDGLRGPRLLRVPARTLPDPDGGRCSLLGQSEPGGLEGACGGELVGLREGGSLDPLTFGASHWYAEPPVGRMAHGLSNHTYRLRGLGNAIVPQVAEWIARRIQAGSLGEECPKKPGPERGAEGLAPHRSV